MLFRSSKNDEWYTPAYAITPILKYIEDKKRVWCPFDTEESLFVSMLKEAGHEVIYTHIDKGEDFFTVDLPECDIIVSNPPFSKKTEVLERLFSFKKPFAILLSVPGIFDSQRRFDLFRNNDFEIMYMNKRVSYFENYRKKEEVGRPPFSSAYVCHKVLPKQIMFEEIAKGA